MDNDKILRQLREHEWRFGYTFTEGEVDEITALYEMNHAEYSSDTLALQIEDYVRRKETLSDSEWKRERRPSVSARQISPGEFTLAAFEKPAATVRLLRTSLASAIAFTLLSEDQQSRLIASMYPLRVSAGTEVVRRGDVGAEIYVIEEGEFEVHSGTAPAKRLGPGDHFGEYALLYEIPRTATVCAVTDARVWAAEQTSFSYIRICDTIRRRELVTSALTAARIPELQARPGALRKAVDAAVFKIFLAGTAVAVPAGYLAVVFKAGQVAPATGGAPRDVASGALLDAPCLAVTDLEAGLVPLRVYLDR